MRHAFTIKTILILMLFAAMAPANAAKSGMAPGSFLKKPASTVKMLSDQVTSDKTVMTRYAKHFRTSPEMLARFFSEDLKIVKLSKPLKAQVYFIAKDGTIKCRNSVLPKGEEIFATKDNKPVLMVSCGNPLRTKLPQKAVIKEAKKKGGAGAVLSESTEVAESKKAEITQEAPEEKVLANPVETIAAAAVTAPSALIAEASPAIAAMTDVAIAPAVSAITMQSVAAAPLVAGGSGIGLGWLGALAGIGGIAAATGGGGGGTTLGPDEPPTPVVPEPSSLLAIGSGLSIMGIGSRYKRLKSLRR